MMDTDRFRALAEVYGGELGRWPPELRAAAASFVDDDPRTAAEVLGGERVLEAWLDAYQVAASPGLAARIRAAAPRRQPAAMRRWLTAAGLGVALAGAGAAGLAAGFTLAPVVHLIGPLDGAGDDLADLADPVGEAGAG